MGFRSSLVICIFLGAHGFSPLLKAVNENCSHAVRAAAIHHGGSSPRVSRPLFYTRGSDHLAEPGQYIMLQDEQGIFPAQVLSVSRDGSHFRIRDGEAEYDVSSEEVSRSAPNVYLRPPNSDTLPNIRQLAYVQEGENKIPVWIESVRADGAHVTFLDGSQRQRVLGSKLFSRTAPHDQLLARPQSAPHKAEVASSRLRALEVEAKKYGIRQRSSFLNLPEAERSKHLADVINEVKKMPAFLLRLNSQMGIHIDLVSGGVANHTQARHLRGVLPRGYQEGGRTWGRVPGAGGDTSGNPTIIAADSLYKNHGCINLVIHEHTHSFDSAMAKRHRLSQSKLSDTPQWLEIHRAYKWYDESYLTKHPEEAFVETVAAYYHSPESRKSWCTKFPRACTFVDTLFRD